MKNKLIVSTFIVLIIIVPTNVYAGRGCCSRHGGVSGCSDSGRQVCRDGTLSPSCTCTPAVKYVYGCTDPQAKNYNSKANKNDGTCQYYKYGCTDPEAKNYDELAEKDDNSCKYYRYGCTDANATNYNYFAEKDDGSCEYKIEETENEDDSSGFLPLLALGGIGAAIYHKKKKKK